MSTVTAMVSMAARDPEGLDQDYLTWHATDHLPELYRVPEVRSAVRIVSTPECRAARAVSTERYDSVDHVVTYLFSDPAGLPTLGAVAGELTAAGRMSRTLPSVEVGVFGLAGAASASRLQLSPEVLPWHPARGVYLLVEQGVASAAPLAEVPGVVGSWWFAAEDGRQLTYCYLEGEPVEVATRLTDVLAARWETEGVMPLLAAPFHTLVPFDWGRYLP